MNHDSSVSHLQGLEIVANTLWDVNMLQRFVIDVLLDDSCLSVLGRLILM